MFSGREKVAHYQQGSFESLDVMESLMSHDEMRGFLWGNAMKYLYRWQKKNNPIGDLQKAQTYLRWLTEWEEKNVQKSQ